MTEAGGWSQTFLLSTSLAHTTLLLTLSTDAFAGVELCLQNLSFFDLCKVICPSARSFALSSSQLLPLLQRRPENISRRAGG